MKGEFVRNGRARFDAETRRRGENQEIEETRISFDGPREILPTAERIPIFFLLRILCVSGSLRQIGRLAPLRALLDCVLAQGGGERRGGAAAAGEQRLADGTVVIPAGSPKLQEIRVEAVKTAEEPFDEVVSPGKIETNPNLVSRVTLPVPGRVAAVLVKLGDAVERGETVLTLESPDADAAESTYLQAQAALTQAKANLNKAQADYDRSTDLFEHNAVAKKDVLTAENALAQAKAALEQAQAALDQSDRRLQMLGLKPGSFGQKLTVPAPISGKILDMAVAPGEYHNDTNAPVMTIADLSTVWVASDVPESDIRLIEVGERIDVDSFRLSRRDVSRARDAHRRYGGPADPHGEGSRRDGQLNAAACGRRCSAQSAIPRARAWFPCSRWARWSKGTAKAWRGWSAARDAFNRWK